jgi:hypothetical protein
MPAVLERTRRIRKLAMPYSDDSDDETMSDNSSHVSHSDHDTNSEITEEDICDQMCKANSVINIRRSAARISVKKNPSLISSKLHRNRRVLYQKQDDKLQMCNVSGIKLFECLKNFVV